MNRYDPDILDALDVQDVSDGVLADAHCELTGEYRCSLFLVSPKGRRTRVIKECVVSRPSGPPFRDDAAFAASVYQHRAVHAVSEHRCPKPDLPS